MAPTPLPPIPASLPRYVLDTPGREALVFAASAASDPSGTASPFLDALRQAWGPERAALADVFLFGAAVPRESVPPSDLLDDVGGGRVASRFRVSPVLGTVVVADAPLGHPAAVLPPSPTTASLAAVLPDDQSIDRALDVGCGAGTLALVLQAEDVVAVDVSARAAALTARNASLHDRAIDTFAGDLLDPVAGQRFELVVSQPPYLPLPPDVPATPYLHGGEVGDELTRRLLAGVPEVLAGDGIAVVRADRAEDATPFAGIEISWPGPDPAELAIAYAAVHVSAEGPARDAVAAAYRAHLPRFRSALVVVHRDCRRGTVEVDQPPVSWSELRALA